MVSGCRQTCGQCNNTDEDDEDEEKDQESDNNTDDNKQVIRCYHSNLVTASVSIATSKHFRYHSN